MEVAVFTDDKQTRDNSVSIQRKEDVSAAYFHCHTDITIPYEELKSITVECADGKEKKSY